MTTAKTTNAMAIAATAAISRADTTPSWLSMSVPTTAPGTSTTTFANRMRARPLPMPRNVIWSASQTANMVPAISVSTVETRNKTPGEPTRPLTPSSATAMP